MKQAFWIMGAVFLALGSSLLGQSITVTSPAANVEWLPGTTNTIQWTSTGIAGNVSIHVYPYNTPGTSGMLIIANTPNDGSHSWPIPLSLAPGTYQVRVQSGSPGAWIFDYSDTFKIKTRPMAQLGNQPGTLGNMSKPDPVQIPMQKHTGAPNLQFPSYANLTSFKVNGQSNSSHTNRIVCHRPQGIVMEANAVSSVEPILYRFIIEMDSPYDGFCYIIFDSGWISQNQKTFTISEDQFLEKISPNGTDGKEIMMLYYGEVKVKAKNNTQSEPPQSKLHAIKFWIN